MSTITAPTKCEKGYYGINDKDVMVSETQQQKQKPNNIEIEFDEFTTSSILEFLNKEQECFNNNCDETTEIDESIFDEINRLTDGADDRSVDEILREAEILISKQPAFSVATPNSGVISSLANKKIKTNLNNKNNQNNKFEDNISKGTNFDKVIIEAIQLNSVISEESVPKDLQTCTAYADLNTENEADCTLKDDDDTTDTVSEK